MLNRLVNQRMRARNSRPPQMQHRGTVNHKPTNNQMRCGMSLLPSCGTCGLLFVYVYSDGSSSRPAAAMVAFSY
jgi:hypothetical protein